MCARAGGGWRIQVWYYIRNCLLCSTIGASAWVGRGGCLGPGARTEATHQLVGRDCESPAQPFLSDWSSQSPRQLESDVRTRNHDLHLAASPPFKLGLDINHNLAVRFARTDGLQGIGKRVQAERLRINHRLQLINTNCWLPARRSKQAGNEPSRTQPTQKSRSTPPGCVPAHCKHTLPNEARPQRCSSAAHGSTQGMGYRPWQSQQPGSDHSKRYIWHHHMSLVSEQHVQRGTMHTYNANRSKTVHRAPTHLVDSFARPTGSYTTSAPLPSVSSLTASTQSSSR